MRFLNFAMRSFGERKTLLADVNGLNDIYCRNEYSAEMKLAYIRKNIIKVKSRHQITVLRIFNDLNLSNLHIGRDAVMISHDVLTINFFKCQNTVVGFAIIHLFNTTKTY